MLPIYSDRSLHSIRLLASNTKDRLFELFFKALSKLNPIYNEYAFYYSHKVKRRKVALTLYPDALVQISSNQLYPGKKVNVPTPIITNDKLYEVKENPKKGKLTELCFGICVDHMRRVKSSKKPFWDTINDLAIKFEHGSTKKGFVNHQIFSQIRIRQKYVNDKPINLLEKIVKKIPNITTSEEILKIWETNKKSIIQDCLHYKLPSKLFNFVSPNFKIDPYRSASQNLEVLPSGDYALYIFTNLQHGHVINVYKRDEGTVVFDPNYGTLFFKDSQKLNSYIATTRKRLYQDEETSLSLFICTDKEVAPC